MPLIPASRVGAMLVGIVVLGLLAGGVRCAAYRAGGNHARLAQLEQNAHKASLAGIRSRAVTDSVTRATDAVTRQVTSQVAANRRLAARLDATLAASDSILSLPPDSVAEGVLRDQLAKTSEVARVFRDSTEMLRNGVDVMLSAQVTERQAWLAERAQNAHLLTAKDAVIRALEGRECRIVWRVPCPTRTQTFVGGVVVGVLTLAAVR